jgi:hypothetical protein
VCLRPWSSLTPMPMPMPAPTPAPTPTPNSAETLGSGLRPAATASGGAPSSLPPSSPSPSSAAVEVGLLACGHSFCFECVETMARRASGGQHRIRCPTCRAHCKPRDIRYVLKPVVLGRPLLGRRHPHQGQGRDGDDDGGGDDATELPRMAKTGSTNAPGCEAADAATVTAAAAATSCTGKVTGGGGENPCSSIGRGVGNGAGAGAGTGTYTDPDLPGGGGGAGSGSGSDSGSGPPPPPPAMLEAMSATPTPRCISALCVLCVMCVMCVLCVLCVLCVAWTRTKAS